MNIKLILIIVVVVFVGLYVLSRNNSKMYTPKNNDLKTRDNSLVQESLALMKNNLSDARIAVEEAEKNMEGLEKDSKEYKTFNYEKELFKTEFILAPAFEKILLKIEKNTPVNINGENVTANVLYNKIIEAIKVQNVDIVPDIKGIRGDLDTYIKLSDELMDKLPDIE